MRDEHQANLGAQIAALRERQGWSQRALAKWMGLDQSAVSRIEAGRRRVSAEELHRFADALHVSADVLLRGEPVEDSAKEADPDASPALRTPAAPAGSRRRPLRVGDDAGAHGVAVSGVTHGAARARRADRARTRR